MSTKPNEILPPLKGVFRGSVVSHGLELTSPDMNNVRPRDTQEKRIRMGQRPALVKWGNGTQVGDSDNPVVAMCIVYAVE